MQLREELARLLARQTAERSDNGGRLWEVIQFEDYWYGVLTESIRLGYLADADEVLRLTKGSAW